MNKGKKEFQILRMFQLYMDKSYDVCFGCSQTVWNTVTDQIQMYMFEFAEIDLFQMTVLLKTVCCCVEQLRHSLHGLLRIKIYITN